MTAVPSTGEDVSLEQGLELYERMLRVRGFELRVSTLYRDGLVPGFVHLCIGQEATAVGVCWPLRSSDVITSTHRGHGHCLAKGLEPRAMFAELMAKEAGTNQGRGGSMHIADPAQGIFGANGIVAAGLPIAVGAALASELQATDHVVVAFFGDGATGQGAFHESLNLAALWGLPIVFVCENNGYAEFSPAQTQNPVDLAVRAAGYGLRHVAVDGNDVEAVAGVTRRIVDELRAGSGPVVLEATTYRWHGHYEGDPERYRTAEELDDWQRRDPLVLARQALVERGVELGSLDILEASVDRELDDALAWAREQPDPSPSGLLDFVVVPRRPSPVIPEVADGRETFRTMDAVHDALEYELAHDERVFLAGVDVGAGGNVFALTRGLQDRWPARVRDTPISETAVVGLAVGAAMAGMRPVVEIMYLDFIGVCFDQLLNQAAKLHYMTGGGANISLTVRTQFGAGRSSGSQHSQSLEALLAHIPGLTVVMPSTPADTYGLLRAAIADPNPVIFIENRLLYGMKGPRPDAGHVVPLGQAAVVRPGKDLTIVSASRMVHLCREAADRAAEVGIEAEIIDLRTVVPLDRQTILDSLRRTARLLVVHEAVTDFGIGAEIAALAADDGFWYLDAPVRRLGAAYTPAPYAPSLERAWLPGIDEILRAIKETVAA